MKGRSPILFLDSVYKPCPENSPKIPSEQACSYRFYNLCDIGYRL